MEKYCMAPDYARFIEYVRENIEDYIDGITCDDVEVLPVVKNNQVVMDALRIRPQGRQTYPLIYMPPFYEQFCLGKDITEVMTEIAGMYADIGQMGYLLEPEDIWDFAQMKDKIVFRLVNGRQNQWILKDCPHRFMADLAVTYRILAGQTAEGISTVLVSDMLMNAWQITEEELYALALINSDRLFPPLLRPLYEELMGSGVTDRPVCSGENELYILTNESHLNGASALCSKGILSHFARAVQADFYILPSSVHEVLLLSAKSDILPEQLKEMIVSANIHMLQKEEILSDDLYFYSCSRAKFEKYSGQMSENLLQ